MLSSDQPLLYRAQGGDRSASLSANAKAMAPIDVGINIDSSKLSDFVMAEVVIYSRQLSLAEIEQVEQYLACKWGFTLTGRTTVTGGGTCWAPPLASQSSAYCGSCGE